eukprot:scaffold90674_cov61-Attheya_sp.AAC.1
MTDIFTPDTADPGAYNYYNALRKTESMERFGNMDLLTDSNTGKEIQVCHLKKVFSSSRRMRPLPRKLRYL